MANVSLFDLKEKLFSLDTEIKTINEWLAEKAADPTVPMSDIKAKQDSLADLTERRSILQKQHDNLEEQQRNAVALQKGSGNGMTEKDVLLKNKAAFYRAVALGDKSRIEKAFDSLSNGTEKGYAGLGALPIPLTLAAALTCCPPTSAVRSSPSPMMKTPCAAWSRPPWLPALKSPA